MTERDPRSQPFTAEDAEDFLYAAAIGGLKTNRDIFNNHLLGDEIYEFYLEKYFWYLMNYPYETKWLLARVAEQQPELTLTTSLHDREFVVE
ncbi:hypothetical protein KC921_00890 [Candidatus Woesebacteria bacterium]|nr:hypothetical protein [Candidatus Woesebacteria bacterium]